MTAITSGHHTAPEPQRLTPLPDIVQLTGATIRGWRQRGYRITEQRVAGWLYLLARSDLESVVYKLLGPIFLWRARPLPRPADRMRDTQTRPTIG